MKKNNIIVFDTSTDTLRIGISINGKESFIDEIKNSKHIENLIPNIDSMIKKLDIDKKSIDYIGVCEGPGSFTGIRVGIATAYGLTLGNDINLLGFSQFEVYRFLLKDSGKMIIPIIDAKKNKFYCAFIKESDNTIEMFDLTKEQILQKAPSDAIFVGRDTLLLKNDYPDINVAYEEGYTSKELTLFLDDLINNGDNFRYPKPIYLRKSEAEITLLSKRREL